VERAVGTCDSTAKIFSTETPRDIRDAHRLYPLGWVPPPPRYIGIIDLARKRDLIYGLQQLTGKILISNNLQVRFLAMNAQNGTNGDSRDRHGLDHDCAI
jgi:hypothetical protein